MDIEIVKDPLHLITRLIDMIMFEAVDSDFQFDKLVAADNNVDIHIYRPPTKLTNNSLIFDKELMNKWWGMGYDYAKNMECEHCHIKKVR